MADYMSDWTPTGRSGVDSRTYRDPAQRTGGKDWYDAGGQQVYSHVRYGVAPDDDGGGGHSPSGGGGHAASGAARRGSFPDLFQPDLYPHSESSSYSGLDPKWRKQIEGSIIPQMIETAGALPETINQYTADAARLYESQSRQAWQEQLPGLLNQLSRRGMFGAAGGSITGDAITNLGRQIVPEYSQKMYEAGMEAAQMHYGVPSILGELASLAKYSESSSYSANPLAPYELLSNFVTRY